MSSTRKIKPESWYVDFFENLPLGIYRSDLEGKLVFCNNALARLFGFESIDELIGYPIIELYMDKKDRSSLIHEITVNGHVKEFPLAYKKKDGTPIWCAVSATGVFDNDGTIELIDGVVRDITEETEDQRVMRALQEGKGKSSEFVFLIDSQTNLLEINRAGANILGLKKEVSFSNTLLELIAPVHRDLMSLFISDVVKNGEEDTVMRLRGRDGIDRYVELRAVLIRKKGKSDFIKIMGQDVTNRIKLQSERLKHEKFKGVLEMAGGVAHRLNQPLTVINNMLNDILSDLHHDSINYEKVAKVHDQMERLNEISRKVRGIKKYEAMDYVAGVKIVDIDKAS